MVVKFLVGGFCKESIVAVVNSNSCTLRFGLGVKGGLFVGGGHKMHNISSLSRAGHLHIGR